MELNYQIKNGNEYAKVPGVSYRENGQVRKRDVIYLGRVIDKEHHIFCNRDRGIFSFDPETGVFGKADETYVSDLKSDGRKKQKILLDFGDSFFLDALLKNIGYDTVLNSLPYRNKDTLRAMVQYYLLCNSANDHAKIWYEGSYASILYPKANLTSQRITDFMEALGRPESVSTYFDSHVAWVKSICDDPAVLMDSTGLPNNIHFPLTAVSNHNGKISREVRMTTLVQRDTGYPLLFRITPGNIVDLSTVTRTLNELFLRDMAADFVIMDAGYYTNENIEELYACEVDFITRLSSKYSIYNEIVKEHEPTLRKKENLIQYKDRYVYMKRVECRIGSKGHTAYAYLGYDVDRGSDESHKAIKRALQKRTTTSDLHKTLENSGLFMIISSLPFEEDGILPAYYTRQLIEQYFDISKGSSRLTPLRVHSEEALYGHLILSMIAATINVYIQNRTNRIYDNKDEIFMTLRNQKCTVYKSKISNVEPQKAANDLYKSFDIHCPLYIEQTDNQLIPRYHLVKTVREEP